MKILTSKAVTLILLILLMIGLCVLMYPSLSRYRNDSVRSKVLADYEKMAERVSGTDSSEMLGRAYGYNAGLSGLPDLINGEPVSEEYQSVLDLNGSGLIGCLTIEKLQVRLPIYHGTGAGVLNNACGHIEGSSLPVGGEGTHAVLSAHRGLPTARLFTDLDKMQVGDLFTVAVLDQTLIYQVDRIRIVAPDDASELRIVPGEDYVTLLTCTPYGVNSHRLLVRGHRIASEEKKAVSINSEAYLIDRKIVTPVIALPMVSALILYVFLKPEKRKGSSTENEEQNHDFHVDGNIMPLSDADAGSGSINRRRERKDRSL